MLGSPLFHLAIFLTVIISVGGLDFKWREASQSLLPTLLGFGLTAHVLIFTLIGGELHRFLSTRSSEQVPASYLQIVNSTFFHVIFVQFVSLTYSYINSSHFFEKILFGKVFFGSVSGVQALNSFASIGNIVGIFGLNYSLLLVISTLISVFRLAEATAILAQGPDKPSEESSGYDTADPEK